MSTFLSNLLPGLSFGSPLILAALVLLPAIWWLLRVTPPMARRVVFPPLRLLLGLKDTEETPARTPWWLLLFRIIAAALVIVALAEPLIGAPPPVGKSGPLVLFIDNGWTAARGWDARQTAINDALNTAARADRAIAIVTTSDPSNTSLLDAGTAGRIARELEPVSYIPDRLAAAKALAKARFPSRPEILWLSDGLEDGNARTTADLLAGAGSLRIFVEPLGKLALALRPPTNETNGFSVDVIRAETAGTREGDVAALGAREEDLAQAHFVFAEGKDVARAKVVLPLEVRSETARVAILNQESAGAVQLLDQGAARRAVGIVSAGTSESTQPLLSDVFYLERALTPYADLQKGTISDLLAKGPSVLILADVGKIAGADHDRVADFVGNGGVLIRFAGGRMTNDVDDLVPVKLRTVGRYLGGALAWAEPQHLAPFGDISPFNGLEIPSDVTVSRQILAEPSVELSDRTWARLADGTPLVTAQQRGRGWIVLVHVTASPAWSTLPLSGLYVGMLRRLLALSAGARPSAVANTVSLPAVETLDGFGRTRKPPAEVLPIHASDFAKATASRAHPPGLYGAQGAALALNAVTKDTALTPFGDLGHRVEAYAGARAIALGPMLLTTALVLILLDALLSLALRGHLSVPRRVFARQAAMLALAFLAMHGAAVRADDAFDQRAAIDTRLAYVVTGLS